MRMRMPFEKTEIVDACLLAVRENKLESAYIRPVVFMGPKAWA